MGKAPLAQDFDPPIERSPHLGAEAAPRDIPWVPSDQSPVKPGRALRLHLLLEAQIRANGERDAPVPPRIFKPSQFYDAPNRTIAARVDLGQSQVMDPSIDRVDNGEGRPPKLVIEPAREEPSNHRLAMAFALERPC